MQDLYVRKPLWDDPSPEMINDTLLLVPGVFTVKSILQGKTWSIEVMLDSSAYRSDVTDRMVQQLADDGLCARGWSCHSNFERSEARGTVSTRRRSWELRVQGGQWPDRCG